MPNDDKLHWLEVGPALRYDSYRRDLFQMPANGRCENCGRCLLGITRIPVLVTYTRSAMIPGSYCNDCNRFYVTGDVPIRDLLAESPLAHEYKLNGKSVLRNKDLQNQKNQENTTIEDSQAKDKRRLSSIPYSVALIAVKMENGEEREFIIVNHKTDTDVKKDIYHYRTEIGLELLSAACAPARDAAGSIGKFPYKVLRSTFVNDCRKKQLIPEQIMLKSGGGLYNSEPKNDEELVDVLMYSPFTDRLEHIYATYNKTEDYCYFDPAQFRKFIYKYGNPGVKLGFSTKSNGGIDWDDFRSESILKAYGYSVSARDGLSSQVRQELLAEIVDLKIKQVKDIVTFLEWTISTHPQDKDMYAREKWALDIKFIQKYQVDPDRFLIFDSKNIKASKF